MKYVICAHGRKENMFTGYLTTVGNWSLKTEEARRFVWQVDALLFMAGNITFFSANNSCIYYVDKMEVVK